MDKIHRIQALERLLKPRRTPIPMRELMSALECSESTARRLLHSYRDDFNAPLVYDPEHRGWRLERRGDDGPTEIPGLWLTPADLHALLAARELLSQIEPGLLGEQTARITERIDQLLHDRGLSAGEAAKRIRLIAIGARHCQSGTFTRVAHALLQRRRLSMRYRRRGAADPSIRVHTAEPRQVSPQRLTWYRGNWYLEAWCHRADAPRRFAVERIQAPKLTDQTAIEMPEDQLEQAFSSAFGIFTGPATQTAVLRFTPERARWVAEETWHPDQASAWLPDGRFELRLPYGHAEELLMDILKYGPDCQVVEPTELRQAAADRLRQALAQYQADG
ncbi:helix-turn-helix transcriptional regulator [Thiorhodococcus minor]|uniref:WYL domain-containing protein n=1 Tax=Thiorhodococcus minor TaxID=57489 RepID=A0A6M0JUQ8_9GAMM|nr:WYL domain-containing protein [Thiorhodococcus minor]NEV60661.1 WYL domain-containing protein [Thiorhodococcus minor]